MTDQTRNLHPTPEAFVAMCLYGKEYSEQQGGSMDFYDNLHPQKKALCQGGIDVVITEAKATERAKVLAEIQEWMIEDILGKKFPLGERKWCIQCAKRIAVELRVKVQEMKGKL